MPLLRYFGWAAWAALLTRSLGCSAPTAPAPPSDLPLNQKINIVIHTDQKWPDRVVSDAALSRLAPEATADSEMHVVPSEPLARAGTQSLRCFCGNPLLIPLKPRF